MGCMVNTGNPGYPPPPGKGGDPGIPYMKHRQITSVEFSIRRFIDVAGCTKLWQTIGDSEKTIPLEAIMLMFACLLFMYWIAIFSLKWLALIGLGYGTPILFVERGARFTRLLLPGHAFNSSGSRLSVDGPASVCSLFPTFKMKP